MLEFCKHSVQYQAWTERERELAHILVKRVSDTIEAEDQGATLSGLLGSSFHSRAC